jgi:NAD+ synthetase
MKIALAQLDYTIGDINGNAQKIIEAAKQAKNADLVVFSEMSVTGYFPADCMGYDNLIKGCNSALELIAQKCYDIPLLLGCPISCGDEEKNEYFNCAVFLYQGQRQVFKKSKLSANPLSDERYFFKASDEKDSLLEIKEMKIAVTIGEDLSNWAEDPLLIENKMDSLCALQPDLVVNLAAVVFDYTMPHKSCELLRQTVLKHEIPLIYVNQIGANANLIYDGGSMVFANNAHVDRRLPFFEEAVEVIDTDSLYNFRTRTDNMAIPEKMGLIHDALTLGIRDYFSKGGFKTAVLGLSGGLDSALVAYFAEKALGAENVRVVLLPSQFSTDHSVNDARSLAEKLNIKYDIVPIKPIYDSFMNTLNPIFENRPFDVTEENLQARIRGVVLMAVSNKFGNVLLNTSNKSEASVGYGTLYGDLCGSLSVIGDVYKSEAFDLARYINKEDEIIPWHTINKAPSAELRPDQKDTDSLPDYDLLDKILFQYIENSKSAEDIADLGFDKKTVDRVVAMVNRSEFKRHQVAPILRVSPRAFGPERNIPIVSRFC